MKLRTWSAGNSGRATAAGFTLIELLAVLMLAGLLLAIAPPLISSAVPGVQLKGATRTLMSALRQTRGLAISEASPQRLLVDMQAREVRVPGRVQAISIPAQVDLQLTVPESQRIDDDQATVSFYPDGSSSGGSIRLARAGILYRVDVDWLTGRVSLVE